MQTFLPIDDFYKSAKVLDYRRLGKQRVEVLQILNTLKKGGGWQHHPAVKMWRGYEDALVEYGEIVCVVWKQLGYKDTCLKRIVEHRTPLLYTNYPFWFGDEEFHLSHKSNLIRKFPEHYGPLWPKVPNDLPYIWPV